MDEGLNITDWCFLLALAFSAAAFHMLLISFACSLAVYLTIPEVLSCILVEVLFTAIFVCYMLFEVRQNEKRERANSGGSY